MNNKLEVIGIDHGWSMMKTVTQVFVTGVKEITTTPALFGDVLEYEGKFYKVGTVRQEVKDTKVEDDSFYLLTLAAVAKELKKRGLSMEFAKTPQVVDVDSLYKDANEKVVFQLINTEQNRSFLEQVPHREFQDLSIIYKLVINADAESIQSIKVTNSLAERLGMNEEQLFKYAAENTRRILPPRIRNMNDVMKEMFLSDGMPEEIAEMMIREVPPEQTLWIISNNRGIDGAVSMLYENELHELAENLESDLYILPSSVHEVLAVSTELTDPEELAQMVAEVNMQKVALEERLSNQVYHYDKDLRKLTLATDTPNKSLDGIVAEPQLVYDAKEKAR